MSMLAPILLLNWFVSKNDFLLHCVASCDHPPSLTQIVADTKQKMAEAGNNRGGKVNPTSFISENVRKAAAA